MLFLDEPTTGLDPQNRANLWEHIRALRDRGTTVFLTTHYLEEADALCDRLMIMDHGEIVAEGTPRELKQQVAGDAILISLRRDDHGRAGAVPAHRPALRPGDRGRGRPDPPLRRRRRRRAAAADPAARRGRPRRSSSMSLSEPTLDDVFLRQTGRSLRDAGPDGSPERPGDGSSAAQPDATQPDATAEPRCEPARREGAAR